MIKFNVLSPKLTVSDIEKTKKYCIDILGFKVEFERQEDEFIFFFRRCLNDEYYI